MWSQVGYRKHHYKASGGNGISVELFQILNDDAVKVLLSICQQIGKITVATGLEKVRFHSNPKKNTTKNAHTTAQLHSSHMLAKECSKFSKPGFNSPWTVNFQMFKLNLEKAKEPEIKLPTSSESLKKHESSRKTSISALWTVPNLWLCGSQQNVKNSERDGNIRPLDLPPEKSVCRWRRNRAGRGTTDWFQIGKGVLQGCILSPCLVNLYAGYILWNVGLDDSQAGIKITGRNINNLRYPDDTTLMAESEGEQKSLLMRVKEESEKLA